MTNTTDAPPVDQLSVKEEKDDILDITPESSNGIKETLVCDEAAEAKLRRKIDLYVVPTVSMLYLFCFIDRANIGNARLAGLEKELGLTGYDYNILLSIFYISYVIFEIPSSLACKWIGPGWFIPATSLGFGICSICTAFVHNLSQAAGVRFLLGIFEAGMMPGIAYYLSRWYRRNELTFRISCYIVMGTIAGAFGGLLASAILTLDSFGYLHSWRMIFAIEGIITCVLAIVSFFTLTDRPETARWLTPCEKELAITRIASERIGASAEVLDQMSPKRVIRGITSPVTLATSFVFLLLNITVQGLAFFLPTIIQTIYPGRSVIYQQLRTVPPYVVGSVFTLLFAYLSFRTAQRMVFFVCCSVLVIVGYVIFLATDDGQARYGATFIIASGAFIFGALTNSHVSANVASDTARSAAIGMNVMCGNIGGLISTWSFLPGDGPDYPIGNGLNLATSCTIAITSSLLWAWMVWDNRKRDERTPDAELAGLTEEQLEDLDWKHPSFRWRV